MATSKKIFCIGYNKTGTTSLGQAFTNLGFCLGSQANAEVFLEDWSRRDFGRIIKYCCSADAFQDVPFSLQDTYKVLDFAFPQSKFVLSVRDSAQQWYDSLTKFHTQVVGKGRIPNATDLKEFCYCEPGWLWRFHQLTYGIDESTLFERSRYMQSYVSHNRQVKDYFKNRHDDLLVLNVSDSLAIKNLCKFLEIEYSGQQMPYLNQSNPIEQKSSLESCI
jgi:hypothetical protein